MCLFIIMQIINKILIMKNAINLLNIFKIISLILFKKKIINKKIKKKKKNKKPKRDFCKYNNLINIYYMKIKKIILIQNKNQT